MSTQVDDIYDWPPDWFGAHRAYRVDRALKTVRRELSGLLADSCPILIFEAAVLQDDANNKIPAHNFTVVKPYEALVCAPILKKIQPAVLEFLADHGDLITSIFDPDWLSQALKDFQALEKPSPELLRRCFDHVVGLVTRIPVRGYTHQVLCEHYFTQSAELRPSWYRTLVAKRIGKEPYGKITAIPNNSQEPPTELNEKDQKASAECKYSKPQDSLMLSFLPLVAEHNEQPSWPKLDLIAIPVHSIHRWNTHTYGTFLGWLYVLRNHEGALSDTESILLKTLWPLLDSFAMELVEGEIQDYLGHYKGAKKPLEELKEAIPRLSGWRVSNVSGEPDAGNYATFRENKLHIRIDVRDSSDESIVIEPRWTTFVPPQKDAAQAFGTKRLANRVRHLYRNLFTAHAQSESSRLRKYEQMLNLLSTPLGNLTESIAEMQRDTQELRAVLYDPPKALFQSHERIKDLFAEGQPLTISEGIHIFAAHEPVRYCELRSYSQDTPGSLNYSVQAGCIVLIEIVCRIFGVERHIRQARTLPELRALARFALQQADDSEVFKELCKDLLWLFDSAFTKTHEVSDIADKDKMQSCLAILKATLFTPFKIDASDWDCKAIELALRPYWASGVNRIVYYQGFSDRLVATYKFENFLTRSPASYASILSFLIQVCLSRSSRRITTAKIVMTGQNYSIIVTFSEKFDATTDSLVPLRSLLRPVLDGLRDWRLLGANTGNWNSAFIDLANKLLGVARKDSPAAVGIWISEDCTNSDVIKLTQLSNSFVVKLYDNSDYGTLELNWL